MLLPFKGLQLTESYFIPPSSLYMRIKRVRDPSWWFQTTRTSRKRDIPFQHKKNRCSFPQTFRNIAQSHPLKKIIHQFSVYFQITLFTLILQVRSSPGTDSHQELILLLQIPRFPMKNSRKLQYPS